MVYVCSDLHGYYDEYIEFLNYVNFKNDDTLYIIGDVFDRGSDGISIIKDTMDRDNVILIKGNHEHTLSDEFFELTQIGNNKSDAIDLINEFLATESIGQESTLYSFLELSMDEKYEIINYLNSLPCYEEISINGNDYLLVHGGISTDDVDTPIDFFEPTDLIFGPHDFDIDYEYATIIVGHLPTRFIEGAEPDFIYHNKDSICVDCGLGFGGRLGVLCLDNMQEYYF